MIDQIQCTDIQAVYIDVQEKNPSAGVYSRLKGPEARRFIDTINDVPPASNVNADAVVIMNIKESDHYLLIFSYKGCFRGQIYLTPKVIVDEILGQKM